MTSNSFMNQILLAGDADKDNNTLSLLSDEIMRAFLAAGSETEDNLNCYSHIEYGVISGKNHASGNAYGLKLKGKNILVSDNV